MAPLRVGIDLGASPLQVGGLVLGKYIVVNGSKVVKVNGEEAPSRADVVQALEDARACVKSYFGAPEFNSAVVVVPNSTSSSNREAIRSIARGAGFNVVNVIDENIAVAYAYAETVRSSTAKRIIIVSITGGVLDVSVVSVGPNGKTFDVEARESHPEPTDLKSWEHESHKKQGPGLFGFVAGAVKDVVVAPIEILSSFLSHPNIGDADVDELVFVGEASKSEKLRHELQKRYPKATVWEGMDAKDIAAYGAGVLAYKDENVQPGLWTTTRILGDVDETGARSDWQDEVMKQQQQLDDQEDVEDEEKDEDVGVGQPIKLSSVVR